MRILRGGTVVDANGTREVDIGIEAGEIAAIGRDLDGEETIEVDGYVAPGLIDAHVHLMMDARPDPSSIATETAPALVFNAAANLRAALEAGVTTVRDLGSGHGVALEAARAVETGTLPGPRVVACGQNVVMTGGHGHWFGREADGPAEVTKAVREQLKRGADVIKCMATGGVLTEGALTGLPELEPEELDALVAAAEAKATPTAAHAHGIQGIKNAVKAGITSIEHGTFMDRGAAELMADHGTVWVPTASALRGIVDADPEAGIPQYAIDKGVEAADAFDDAWSAALDAGVTIAMGTDAGTPFNPLGDAATELEYMVDYGLDPEGALEAATVNAADLLGLDDVGLVREGFRADLVVLDDDPREDVTTWQDPSMVVAAGDLV